MNGNGTQIYLIFLTWTGQTQKRDTEVHREDTEKHREKGVACLASSVKLFLISV